MQLAFLVLWKTEKAVPARDKYHVVFQVLPLNLQLLHNNNVRLQNVKHGAEGAVVAPWLVSERVADAVDVPGRNTEWHGRIFILETGECG